MGQKGVHVFAQRLQWGILGLALLSGCLQARVDDPTSQRNDSAARAQAATITNVTVKEAHDILTATNPPYFIDVRTPGEYATGRAKGAKLHPLDALDEWSAQLPKTRKLLIICRSGSRSMKAAQALVERGFTQVTNIQGGTLDWEAQGLPLDR